MGVLTLAMLLSKNYASCASHETRSATCQSAVNRLASVLFHDPDFEDETTSCAVLHWTGAGSGSSNLALLRFSASFEKMVGKPPKFPFESSEELSQCRLGTEQSAESQTEAEMAEPVKHKMALTKILLDDFKSSANSVSNLSHHNSPEKPMTFRRCFLQTLKKRSKEAR